MEITFDPVTHTYTVGDREVPHVTGILKTAGLVDDRWYTEWARQRGTAVHVACQLWNDGRLDEKTVDERILGYLEAWKTFLKNATMLGFILKESEKCVYSSTYCFAGTVDVIGEWSGRPCIIDIKTGNPGRIAGVQLAGYEIALADTIFGNEIMRRLAVQLFDDGKLVVTEYESAADRACFMGALSVVNWLRENGGKL